MAAIEADFRTRQQDWLPKLVLAPSFAVTIFFVYGFILFSIVLSFTGSKMLPRFTWVGFGNYEKLFALPAWNTAIVNIAIKGRVVNGVHPSRRNIPMLFQSYALYPNMTLGQNMTFGLEMHDVPKPDREKALAEVGKLLQIDHLLDRKPGSGGQRQRVAMGRALVRDPDVFLFDELLSNLDARLRVDMRTKIKKLHRKLRTTIIHVTHDQIEATTLSTPIAVMDKGHVQQLGALKAICDTPANLFVAPYMGSPAMNIVPATVVIESGQPHAAITDPEGADRKSGNIHPFTNRVAVTEPAGQTFDFVVNMEKAVAFDPATENRIPA